ncbi:MAG: phtD [Chloroflexi bacterium]|nr:phtD [Chloroflexota bacterium]
MHRPRITLAVNSYDRHSPLLEATVDNPTFDFDVLEVSQSQEGRHGNRRHERFLHTLEWDACELSLSSYLVARDQGAPIEAVPVFPRRLFSQSQMYKHLGSGIHGPSDLVGKRVGLNTYQTTLSVLAKGDLDHVYGVPWKSITWVTSRQEGLEVELPSDVTLELATTEQIDQDLAEGRIHAYFGPHPPKPYLQGHPNVGRLFADPKAEEERYLREEGYFPIMHVVAFKRDTAERYPELPGALFTIFEDARQLARTRWDDPNWSLLVWGRHELERQQALCGFDPWRNGLEANRKNLERFATYSNEQGLTSRRLSPDEVFPTPAS